MSTEYLRKEGQVGGGAKQASIASDSTYDEAVFIMNNPMNRARTHLSCGDDKGIESGRMVVQFVGHDFGWCNGGLERGRGSEARVGHLTNRHTINI